MSQAFKTKAIVLNSLPYADSDLIVTFLMPEQGIVKGMAKGARKSRKRFAGCFEPFNLLSVELFIKAHGGLARVDSADILNARFGIREALSRIHSGAFMLELVSLLETPGTEAGDTFVLLDTALDILDGSSNPAGLAAVFAVKYLKVAGYKLPLETCAKCGSSIIGREAVYPGGHGLLCLRCFSHTGGVHLSRGGLAFLRQAESIESGKMGRLRLSLSARRECFLLLRQFIEAMAGKRLKSLDIQAEFC